MEGLTISRPLSGRWYVSGCHGRCIREDLIGIGQGGAGHGRAQIIQEYPAGKRVAVVNDEAAVRDEHFIGREHPSDDGAQEHAGLAEAMVQHGRFAVAGCRARPSVSPRPDGDAQVRDIYDSPRDEGARRKHSGNKHDFSHRVWPVPFRVLCLIGSDRPETVESLMNITAKTACVLRPTGDAASGRRAVEATGPPGKWRVCHLTAELPGGGRRPVKRPVPPLRRASKGPCGLVRKAALSALPFDSTR